MKKKIALLLAFALVLSMLPAGALLAEYDNGEEYAVTYDNGDEDYDNEDEAYDNGDEDYDDEYAEEDEEEYAEEYEAEYLEEEYDEDYYEEYVAVVEEEVYVEIMPIMAPIAVTTTPTALRFVIGQATFTLNGEVRQLDVAPYIDPDYDRTMLPYASFGEAIGAEVDWNEETRTVSFLRDGVLLELNVDAPLPGGMGVPTIQDGRTFVPVAYVAYRFGAVVTWNAATMAVTIEL